MTIHHLWRGASENVSTVALYAIVRNFHHSSPLSGCFRECKILTPDS
ncbi:hypothetical protein [Okeania sp. SIO3I5]|nr:hypothetical protein [Okeania sp. SIO3I5]